MKSYKHLGFPQDIEDEISDRAPIIENFNKVSEVLVQNAQPGDKEDLLREVNHVTEALNSIVTRTADRRRILEAAEPLAEKYHNTLQMLAEVITEVESKLNTQRAFGAEPEKINEEIEEVKVGIPFWNDWLSPRTRLFKSVIPIIQRAITYPYRLEDLSWFDLVCCL